MGICTSFSPMGAVSHGKEKEHGTCIVLTVPNDGYVYSFVKVSLYPALMSGHTSYTVDWGDGTQDVVANMRSLPSHTYAKAGDYEITVSNDLARSVNFRNGNFTIKSIAEGLTDGSYMFYYCNNLTGAIPELPSGLTDGSFMFCECSCLTGAIPELPSGLTDGSCMFYYCNNLTGTWTDDPALLMPSHVTIHIDYVIGCAAAVRAKYYISWGGTIPDPT